ncbi:hypothetical protein [Tritonibacter mobilis]|uniref:hypothetical protein n=1 Tax=Tritonibacter mobilis TaxID=379347 RepID=UPI000806CC55|nr:hypothetical protein [Tritonibacter mobilis]GLP86349.1 hypothetical protein GCM10007921_19090 [Tritonibacter mobilis]SDX15065.1 hypothetical protein SAMN05444385_105113 [Tritonibacter mobilis]
MIANKIEVRRTEDGQILVSKGTWSDTFPEEQREAWVKWYEQMHNDYAYDGYALMAQSLRDLS